MRIKSLFVLAVLILLPVSVITAETVNRDSISDENQMRQKEIKIQDNKVVLFEQGKAKHEIALGERVVEETVNGVKVKRKIERIAKVNKKHTYVGIVDIPVTDKQKHKFVFQLLNEDGERVWQKELPIGQELDYAESIVISDNAETIVLGTHQEEGSFPKLIILNNNGEDFSSKFFAENQRLYPSGDIVLSPNGRYLGNKVYNANTKIISTIFADLQQNAWWDYGDSYDVYRITNDGVAKISPMKKKGTVLFNE